MSDSPTPHTPNTKNASSTPGAADRLPDPTRILAPGVAEGEQFAHVREMFNTDYATANIGAEIIEIREGYCRGRFTIAPEMCNGHGTTQGGYIFTFADSVFAGACNSFGEIAVAAHNSIHYIAPTHSGDVVEAEGRVVQRWGRNGIVDVAVTCNGRAVAEFRGTFRTIPAKPEKRTPPAGGSAGSA